MGQLSDLFSMSKRERVGAWAIAVLIVLLLAAVFVEKRCSSDVPESSSQKEIKEYVEKTKNIKVAEGKKKKSSTKKGSSNSKSGTKSKDKAKKHKKKKSSTSKKDKKQQTSNSAPNRAMEPLPQF
jgi:uncharacterized membrane protein YhiD involved in acid resistance